MFQEFCNECLISVTFAFLFKIGSEHKISNFEFPSIRKGQNQDNSEKHIVNQSPPLSLVCDKGVTWNSGQGSQGSTQAIWLMRGRSAWPLLCLLSEMFPDLSWCFPAHEISQLQVLFKKIVESFSLIFQLLYSGLGHYT